MATIMVVSILLLRVISAMVDYVDRPPIVTEAHEQFPRDSEMQYALPRVGVQFRQNGWRPFADPRYIRIVFEQGVISMSGNVTYADLGTKECAFVDRDGRLIADGALCPRASGDSAGYLQGDFHDATFAFVRARARKVLDEFAALPDREIVAFTHGTFIRALQCEVLGLNCHHFGACPPTGTPTEVRLIEVTATGERYWELGDQDAKVQNLSKNAPTSRPRVSRMMTHGG